MFAENKNQNGGRRAHRQWNILCKSYPLSLGQSCYEILFQLKPAGDLWAACESGFHLCCSTHSACKKPVLSKAKWHWRGGDFYFPSDRYVLGNGIQNRALIVGLGTESHDLFPDTKYFTELLEGPVILTKVYIKGQMVLLSQQSVTNCQHLLYLVTEFEHNVFSAFLRWSLVILSEL